MSMQQKASGTTKSTPVIAADAPWRWFAAGWKNFMRAPILSISYGALFVAIGACIVVGLIAAELQALIPAFIGAFALIAPLFATGLYGVADRLSRGETPSFSLVAPGSPNGTLQLAYMGIPLLMGLIAWTLSAWVLFVLFSGEWHASLPSFLQFVLGTPGGLAMLVIGTAVGAIIAFTIFALTAFSVPMLVDREVDVITATATSVSTVKANLAPALLWAWIIGGCMVISALTMMVGFMVLFPVLGYATWHGYKDVFGEGVYKPHTEAQPSEFGFARGTAE